MIRNIHHDFLEPKVTNYFSIFQLPLPHRQTNWWNGTRGFFSRGGGGAAEEQLTLEDIAKNVREQRYKRVVVMAGAGISTPSGIPDFR